MVYAAFHQISRCRGYAFILTISVTFTGQGLHSISARAVAHKKTPVCSRCFHAMRIYLYSSQQDRASVNSLRPSPVTAEKEIAGLVSLSPVFMIFRC